MKDNKDRDEVLAAVKQNGPDLKYADKSLQKDREIVMAAVKQNGWALQYADESLQKDKEIVMTAVKQDGLALEHADESFRKDREVVMAAVKQDGSALEHADESFRKDREVVLEAVKQEGYALDYADESFRKDREIIMAAVKQTGGVLKLADESLKKDREVVLEAVKTYGSALEYADESLKKDKDFIKAADGMEIDLPEISFSCPELTYFDFTVEAKDLNSIEKISDAIDDIISGGESDSTAHLVLGKLGHYKNPHSNLDYLEMEDPDVDISDWTSENKGKLIENPKKGEVVFVYFYYYDHADYVLTKNENFNNICFEFKSFKDEAVLTRRDYSGFDLTANDASGGGEYRLEIICSNSQSFHGTPEGKDELIEELHDYLTTPKG